MIVREGALIKRQKINFIIYQEVFLDVESFQSVFLVFWIIKIQVKHFILTKVQYPIQDFFFLSFKAQPDRKVRKYLSHFQTSFCGLSKSLKENTKMCCCLAQTRENQTKLFSSDESELKVFQLGSARIVTFFTSARNLKLTKNELKKKILTNLF